MTNRRNIRRIAVIAALAMATGLGGARALAADNSDTAQLAAANTAFALDLYQQLRDSSDGNLFLSPYSISTALAMTYGGARGDTERQMAETLHFALGQERLHRAFAALEKHLRAVQERGGVQLHVANSLWPHKDYAFLKEYLDLCKRHYAVTITPVDYVNAREEALRVINAWVEKRTDEKIKELITADLLDALTRLVLVNAIYFKGEWANRFDEAQTKDQPFYVAPDKPVAVPMMSQMRRFRFAANERLQALELPYAGNDLSMVVLLPTPKFGLSDLEAALTAENLEKWIAALREQPVRVFLPRFKMTSQFLLNETLRAMGMPDAFDADKANFAGMDGDPKSLYISAVVHKAFVDVNEAGTEAAAATAVVMQKRGAPPTVFRADRPFLFLVRDNQTGSILFLGRVADPTAAPRV